MASQRTPGPHSGIKATLTPGDPLSRSMGQYGKGHDPMAAYSAGLPSVVDEKPAPEAIRGGKGGIKTHPKMGAFSAPARMYGKEGDNS